MTEEILIDQFNDDKNAVAALITESFYKSDGIDLNTDSIAMLRINEAVEKAFRDLNYDSQAIVNLPFIYADSQGPKNLNIKVRYK